MKFFLDDLDVLGGKINLIDRLQSSMIKTVETLDWLSLINFPFRPVSNHLREPTIISINILCRNVFFESLRTENIHLQDISYDIFL